MFKKLSYGVYRAVVFIARRLFPSPTLEGVENLPEGPCVIVGNHAQMYGPIAARLYVPGDPLIWCTAEMMHLEEVPDYAYRDFWSMKPKTVRWFYRLLSYVIAPISVCVFTNARCIGVYRDMRLTNTLRETLRGLQAGASVVIFPEHGVAHNRVVCDFQEGFVNLGQLFARRTGEALSFVPMYVAPRLRKVVFGAPVRYQTGANPEAERRRVCDALMDAVTALAVAQPRHRMVPYLNLPRRQHPYNTPDEVTRI